MGPRGLPFQQTSRKERLGRSVAGRGRQCSESVHVFWDHLSPDLSLLAEEVSSQVDGEKALCSRSSTKQGLRLGQDWIE